MESLNRKEKFLRKFFKKANYCLDMPIEEVQSRLKEIEAQADKLGIDINQKTLSDLNAEIAEKKSEQ